MILIQLISGKVLKAQYLFFEDIKIGADYHYGYLLPEYGFIQYLTESHINALEFNISKQVSGDKLWHHVYHFPHLGFSAYYSSLGNKDVLGNALAFNPFIDFNLIIQSRFYLKYKIGVGLCYVSKHFDPDFNYKNIPVGSSFNIWFNSDIYTIYHVSKNISLNTGIGFNHLSNANLAEPNIGLNYLTFFAGSEVLLSDRYFKETIIIPKHIKHYEFSVVLGAGIKKTRRFAPETYLAGSTSFEAVRILNHKLSIGTGVDLFFDNSIIDEMIINGSTDLKSIYQYKSGIHLSQELLVGNLSLIIHEGIYIGLTDKLENNTFYNKGIIRYKFSKHWFANLAMKSNLFVLDAMEMGIGYYWK
jgi:hypothetical protein